MDSGIDEPLRLPAGRRGRLRGRAEDASVAQIEVLFRRLERRLGRYLAQMVADRALAEDLLQDTFHDAFASRAQLPGVRNPDAWLYGIARNRALNALRKRRRLSGALERLTQRHHRDVEDADVVATRDLLARAVSADDRAMLLLRHLHGFDSNELAEMTGRSPEAVRQRLARARARVVAAADSTAAINAFTKEDEDGTGA